MNPPRIRHLVSGAAVLVIGVGTWGLSAAADHPSPVLGDPYVEDGLRTSHTVDPQQNLHKVLGEPGQLVTEEGDPLFSISVMSVDEVSSCPSRAQDLNAVAGDFVVLEVTAEVREEILAFTDEVEEDVYFPLQAETFTLIDTSGEPIEGTASYLAWECYPDTDLLPGFIFPGESARGLVVLETSSAISTVAYMPADAPGWEWSLQE